jgi:hypothetical protein
MAVNLIISDLTVLSALGGSALVGVVAALLQFSAIIKNP